MPGKIDQLRRVSELQCYLANELTWTHRLFS